MQRHVVSYLFVAPFMALFLVFIVAPVIAAVYLSGTYFNLLEAPIWLGLANYRLLFLSDDIFLIAVANTLTFAVITGPLGFILSFVLAWFINRVPIRTPYTLAFYTPSITSAIAMAIVWKFIFSNDRYGLMNNIGMQLGVLYEPFPWLSHQDTILPVIMFVSLWMSMGTNFLVFLAGLQNVPTELYEAGRVDGISSPVVEAWHITLPMMRPQLLFGAVMSIVISFTVFQIALQLVGLPSPLYAGHTIVAHLYDYAFIRFEMGYASAIAVILFLFTFLLGRTAMRMFASED
jgi:multiple sugar transport system permease protein